MKEVTKTLNDGREFTKIQLEESDAGEIAGEPTLKMFEDGSSVAKLSLLSYKDKQQYDVTLTTTQYKRFLETQEFVGTSLVGRRFWCQAYVPKMAKGRKCIAFNIKLTDEELARKGIVKKQKTPQSVSTPSITSKTQTPSMPTPQSVPKMSFPTKKTSILDNSYIKAHIQYCLANYEDFRANFTNEPTVKPQAYIDWVLSGEAGIPVGTVTEVQATLIYDYIVQALQQ